MKVWYIVHNIVQSFWTNCNFNCNYVSSEICLLWDCPLITFIFGISRKGCEQRGQKENVKRNVKFYGRTKAGIHSTRNDNDDVIRVDQAIHCNLFPYTNYFRGLIEWPVGFEHLLCYCGQILLVCSKYQQHQIIKTKLRNSLTRISIHFLPSLGSTHTLQPLSTIRPTLSVTTYRTSSSIYLSMIYIVYT